MNILFLCRGNVGRSVFAEGLFNKLASDKHHATSAGTKLSGPEQPINELSPAVDNVLVVMNEEGIDVAGHVRTQVTKEMVNTADKVVLVVDNNDQITEYLLDSPKVVQWEIVDPKGKSLEVHENTKNEIKNLIKKYIEDLG